MAQGPGVSRPSGCGSAGQSSWRDPVVWRLGWHASEDLCRQRARVLSPPIHRPPPPPPLLAPAAQGAWVNSQPQGDHTGQSVNMLKAVGEKVGAAGCWH